MRSDTSDSTAPTSTLKMNTSRIRLDALASLDEGVDEDKLRSAARRLAILYRENRGNTPPAQLLTSVLTLSVEQERALAEYTHEMELSPIRRVNLPHSKAFGFGMTTEAFRESQFAIVRQAWRTLADTARVSDLHLAFLLFGARDDGADTGRRHQELWGRMQDTSRTRDRGIIPPWAMHDHESGHLAGEAFKGADGSYPPWERCMGGSMRRSYPTTARGAPDGASHQWRRI